MPDYIVILPENYDIWEAMSPSQRAEVYEAHDSFVDRLKAGGHRITCGGELDSPATARTVRWQAGKTVVTDGPFAESVEHLGGFYLINSPDLEDLEDACGMIAWHSPVEIRPIGQPTDEVHDRESR